MTADPFVGQILMVGYTFAPKGWAMCNGQMLEIAQNAALFSLLGTTYGGDGRTTFALPDLRGRFPLHASPQHILGGTGGAESVTLMTQQLPFHAHTLPAAVDQTTDRPVGAAPANGGNYGPPAGGMAQSGGTGGGQPHDNMPPFLALNFIIALAGIFPARP